MSQEESARRKAAGWSEAEIAQANLRESARRPRAQGRRPAGKSLGHWTTEALRRVVMWLAVAGGLALVAMMAVTCMDVLLRAAFNAPIKGTIDLVGILGALAIACSLPYTTAVKGHVAVEYFFLKLGPRGRVWVDALNRLLMTACFVLLAWQCFSYGNALRASQQVTPTLELPIFWVPWVIGACFIIMVGIKVYHLANPGKSLLKP